MVRGSLAWFLSPITPATFEREFFQRQPLHVTGRDGHYAGLLGLAEVDRVITGLPLKVPQVRMARAGNMVPSSALAREDGTLDPLLIAEQLERGATLVWDVVERWSHKIARLCRRLGRDILGPSSANLYLTPARSSGFAPHVDASDVFVLQLMGEKSWSLHAPPAAFPSLAPSKDVPIGPPTRTVTLRPGDLLYIPRDHAHGAVAGGAASMHLTVGFVAPSWVTVLGAAVERLAEDDERFRRAFPLAALRTPERAQRELRALLQVVLAGADATRAVESLRSGSARARSPLVPGQLIDRLAPTKLTPRSLVGARAALDARVRVVGEEIEVALPGRLVTAPKHAGRAMRYALTHRRFEVRDLPGLDDDSRLVLVERLLREGALRRLPDSAPPRTHPRIARPTKKKKEEAPTSMRR